MLQAVTLPASLAGLLQPFRPCFTAPSFRTFTALVLGLVCQTGTRTVCGMLSAAGLAGLWHHSRAHWFFANARWCADQLGLVLLRIVVQRLLPAQAPLVLAVDDSLFRRCGRKVFGTQWHHDATVTRKPAVAWGHNRIVVGVVVTLPGAARPAGLPIPARPWRTGCDHKSATARTLIETIATAYPDRPVHVVADAYYGTKHWRGLDRRITLTVRLRHNGKLTEIHTPLPGATGRPKLRGAPIGRPDDLATRAHLWRSTQVRRYGRTEATWLLDHRCLWTGPLLSQPVRAILTRDRPTRRDGRGYDLALITTDLTSSAEHLIARYAARWALEVTFHEAKNITGVGQARTRVRRAVERAVPFGLLTYGLVLCWYTLHGHHPSDVAHRRQAAPWYLSKTEPSYLDMLTKLRRITIAARFMPASPRTPTPQETLAVHAAWAHAAA